MVTMSLLARKRLLVAANAVLAAGILACVSLAALLPPAVDDVNLPQDQALSAGGQAQGRTGPLNAYAVIHKRRLRKPLFDLKPIVPGKVEPPRPKLAVRLIGTAVEPGFTYGLFRTKSGESKLVSVGQKIGGAEVISVGDGTATLRFGGEMITLKVEKEGARR